ncbi:MAG: RND transporter, partial [Gammaproteobacteria bacterium]
MQRHLSALGGLALALVAGCAAVGPDYQGPPVSMAETLPAWPSGGADPAAVTTAAPAQAWWRALGDAELDAL